MKTLKNRPKTCFKESSFTKWFEGFETKMRLFRDSQVRCVEWLQKYTMIDPLDAMKLMQVQAAIRTFIEKEILGE